MNVRSPVLGPQSNGDCGATRDDARKLRDRERARCLLFDVYAPPSVLINGNCECVGYFGAVQRYLSIAGKGEKPLLFAIAHEVLQDGLRTALRLGYPKNAGRSLDSPEPGANEHCDSLRIAVRFIQGEVDSFLLVSFLEPGTRLDQECAPASLGSVILPLHTPVDFPIRAGIRLACLSPRQRAVLDLVAKGRSNKQIAGDLGISPRTVETHRVIVMRKLGARNVADLIRLVAAA
jgi:DNA-binding CsgD family transcriptional regulator